MEERVLRLAPSRYRFAFLVSNLGDGPFHAFRPYPIMHQANNIADSMTGDQLHWSDGAHLLASQLSRINLNPARRILPLIALA